MSAKRRPRPQASSDDRQVVYLLESKPSRSDRWWGLLEVATAAVFAGIVMSLVMRLIR